MDRLTNEVITICNKNARQLKIVAENSELFSVLEQVNKQCVEPKPHKKIMVKERIIITLISVLCLVLSIQHVILTLSAFNKGADVFYPGWQTQDAAICLLMVITMSVNYLALLIVQRQERGSKHGV